MKTIVLTGGGTAGHVMPNIALLPDLQKHFSNIIYIGTNGIEKQIAQSYNLPFYEISASKLTRKSIFKNLSLPFKLISSVSKSKKILKEINPDIVFSKGGFVALPVVIASKQLGIPVLSHESDLSMGLANKVILKFATLVLTSFEKTAKNKNKCLHVGSPIRQEIFHGNKQKARELCGFEQTNKKTILFFGGSLGAEAINQILITSAKDLLKNFNIIHITGKNNKTNIKESGYFQIDFTNEIQDFFALADIVISRAGANSLFELLALKKPMILIPLPKGTSRGDQVENAIYFQEKGYAKVIHQENLNKSILLKTINELDTKKLISNMQNTPYDNANKKIITQILRHTKKR